MNLRMCFGDVLVELNWRQSAKFLQFCRPHKVVPTRQQISIFKALRKGKGQKCQCVNFLLQSILSLSETFSLHIKICPLLWFEFFRTMVLFLGVFREFIIGYSKSSLASAESLREIFGRAIFTQGYYPSLKVGDEGRRTGEGTGTAAPNWKVSLLLQSTFPIFASIVTCLI